MNGERAHFVELPTEREALWGIIAHFLNSWRIESAEAQTSGVGELASVEADLGRSFSLWLREFYSEFSVFVRAGFFNDKDNTLLPPEKCYLVSEFMKELECRTLVIAENFWGALWGIREDELVNPNPQIRCLDNCGGETDGLFSLTEFLVGLLFRSAVINAPIRFVVECSHQQEDLVDRIHSELLANFPSWNRDNLEEDCGFLSHIEGLEILATLSEESLTIGLRNPDSINTLPEPLRSVIADLNS